MITCYARTLGRDERQNVLVENGVVVKQYVAGPLFRGEGNPELVGQPEAALQALGFEQVPGPLHLHWGQWVSITVEEMQEEEEKTAKFYEEAAKAALKVFGSTIHIHVPKFHPILCEEDWFKVEKWSISEGDRVQANDPLVSIDCALGTFDIPVPPQADEPYDEPYRVERLCVPAGSPTHLGELVVVLERIGLDKSQEPPHPGKREPLE